ncbi:hypothetical protein ACP4OV_025353 [Aristida adscensionis]
MERSKTKKQRNDVCIINSLPRDLVEKIFLSLPVSTLLGCSAVCKQWCNFIRDPQFVKAHLQIAPHCTLLFFPQESISKKLYPSDAVILDEAWSPSTWAVPAIGPDDYLSGSCNGLLCLYTKTSTIKIANFATGECLHLEKPVKNLKGDHFSLYNFGFHPVTKEYKVIHFLGGHGHGKNSQGTFNVIQVYTLGSEKWRDVATPEALSFSSVKNSGVVNVNGTMYWLTEDSEASWKHAVMSFDLGEETFTRIQLPTIALEEVSPGSYCRHQYWITEMDGTVCVATGRVFRRHPRVLVGKLQVWTLESKLEHRWSQMYCIQFNPDHVSGPNFIFRDKIMLHSRFCDLYLYELLGKNCSETALRNVVSLLNFNPRNPNNMQSYTCVKSLVRLDAYKKVGGVVHRPKQREGWQLKKWEAWERKLCEAEDLRSYISEVERGESVWMKQENQSAASTTTR